MSLPVAAVPALDRVSASPAAVPLVLVEGVVEPRLSVAKVEALGPLDERRAEVDAAADTSASRVERWLASRITVAMPLRLSDASVRWRVLLDGHATATRHEAGAANVRLTLRDDWTARLAQPAPLIYRMDRGGDLVTRRDGSPTFRSSRTFDIAGRRVHVPAARGEAWTVGTMLAYLLAIGGLDATLALVPPRTAEAAAPAGLNLARPLGEAVRRVLESANLRVRRDATRTGGETRQHAAIIPAHGPGTMRGESARDAVRARRDEPVAAAVAAARRWIVRGGRPVVESTFELLPAWDAALQGQPTAAYDRGESADFERYAAVYRLWALNEDGRFSLPPFSRGPAYDLAGLFEDERVRPTPRRFEPCLTLDATGRRRSPVVEVSMDGGGSWSRWAGSPGIERDLAAVSLNDATLPGDWVAAAEAGEARVRVTASLVSPLPDRGGAVAG